MPKFLVVVQVTSIFILALTGEIIPSSTMLFLLQTLFVIFGVWAMVEMKFRFNIFPELLKNSSLVTSGPFKIVRHPIYTSGIFITLIWIINDFSYLRLFVWLLLVFILNIKTLYEEKILDKEFSDYKYYKNKTKKLIPFLY